MEQLVLWVKGKMKKANFISCTILVFLNIASTAHSDRVNGCACCAFSTSFLSSSCHESSLIFLLSRLDTPELSNYIF